MQGKVAGQTKMLFSVSGGGININTEDFTGSGLL